jgi:hypothetical protein
MNNLYRFIRLITQVFGDEPSVTMFRGRFGAKQAYPIQTAWLKQGFEFVPSQRGGEASHVLPPVDLLFEPGIEEVIGWCYIRHVYVVDFRDLPQKVRQMAHLGEPLNLTVVSPTNVDDALYPGVHDQPEEFLGCFPVGADCEYLERAASVA